MVRSLSHAISFSRKQFSFCKGNKGGLKSCLFDMAKIPAWGRACCQDKVIVAALLTPWDDGRVIESTREWIWTPGQRSTRFIRSPDSLRDI